jgi:hypothetical protein
MIKQSWSVRFTVVRDQYLGVKTSIQVSQVESSPMTSHPPMHHRPLRAVDSQPLVHKHSRCNHTWTFPQQHHSQLSWATRTCISGTVNVLKKRIVVGSAVCITCCRYRLVSTQRNHTGAPLWERSYHMDSQQQTFFYWDQMSNRKNASQQPSSHIIIKCRRYKPSEHDSNHAWPPHSRHTHSLQTRFSGPVRFN